MSVLAPDPARFARGRAATGRGGRSHPRGGRGPVENAPSLPRGKKCFNFSKMSFCKLRSVSESRVEHIMVFTSVTMLLIVFPRSIRRVTNDFSPMRAIMLTRLPAIHPTVGPERDLIPVHRFGQNPYQIIKNPDFLKIMIFENLSNLS